MAHKNDDRIMQLKNQIAEKKAQLANKTDKFAPKTNCLLVLDKVTYNLHVEASALLLIKVNTIAMSAKNLGYDITELEISGYSLDKWIDDIRSFLEVKAYREEKRKLDKLEQKLTALLSDDKKTELEIDSIAAMLGV